MLSIINILILPPAINLIFLLLGLFLLRFWWLLGSLLIAIAIGTLYFFSTAVGAKLLMNPLQLYPPITYNPNAEGIVVLSASVYQTPAGMELSNYGLKRVLYGVEIHQDTKLPIFISGGGSGDSKEALIMEHFLEKEFHIDVKEVETKSHNTYENARNVAMLLTKYNIHQFYLVTNAWHIPRAMWVFQKLGLQPIPAPSDYADTYMSSFTLKSWLPTATSLRLSSLALHEHLGMMWYKFHYRSASAALI